jgi:hypothetical protein
MDPERKQRLVFFKLLSHIKAKQASIILKTALAQEQTTLIAELATNCLAGNINIDEDTDKTTLFKKRALIRKLATDGASHKFRLAVIKKNAKAVYEILAILLKSL